MPFQNPFFSRTRVPGSAARCFGLAVSLATSFLFPACGLDSLAAIAGRGVDPDRIRIMAWNAQTFFDDRECGNEFSEFRGVDSGWTTERYEARLDRLRDVILLAGSRCGTGPDRGPEIVALEEIENARVIRDLCNRMPAAADYGYAAFVPSTGKGAFGTALLSRYPILSLTAHTPLAESVSVRPLLEASLDAPCGALTVFVVHWKSQLGEDGGVSLRAAQERSLRERVEALTRANPLAPYVACGDFNCDPEDSALLADSPGFWANADGVSGSYWYDGAWERIDNMVWPQSLLSGTAWRVTRSFVLAESPLVDPEGRPDRYQSWSGKGYSDHLPLVAEIRRENRAE